MTQPPRFPLGPALEFMERLWAMNHSLERLSLHMAKNLGVTAQQRLILRCLGKYPEILAGQLASLLHLDPGTISAALARLEDRNILTRRRDPSDRRRSVLSLTAKGQTLNQATPGTVESVVERLLSETTQSDLEATKRVLERLTALLNAEAGSSEVALV